MTGVGSPRERRRAAVLGSPIGHSLSPTLHRAAYAGLGLDWSYDAFDVDVPGLAGFLAGCGPEWAGLSLTMPLKRAVLPLLDGATELVGVVGGANTVVFGPGGRVGHNTDVAGMVAALRGIGAEPGPAVVLGGGATAASALAALAQMGCPGVVVHARRPEAASELALVAQRIGLDLAVRAWPERLPSRAEASIVVSTVPGSAAAGLVGFVPTAPGWLLDVTYAPWPPALVAAWGGRGRPSGGRRRDAAPPGRRAGPPDDRARPGRGRHAHGPALRARAARRRRGRAAVDLTELDGRSGTLAEVRRATSSGGGPESASGVPLGGCCRADPPDGRGPKPLGTTGPDVPSPDIGSCGALLLVVSVGILGLLVGSFLTMVIRRVPVGESIWSPAPYCPSCRTPLRARDSIPVVSWLLLRGRCRHCQAPIGARAPAVELVTGLLFVAMALRFGLSWELPAFLYVTAVGVALAVIDLDTKRLPNALTLPSYPILAGLLLVPAVLVPAWPDLVRALLGGLALLSFYLVMALIYPAGMGMGDVKLAGVLGMALGWLGWGVLFVGGFLGFAYGALVGVALIVGRRAGRGTAIPFGPFMVAGTLTGVLVGEQVVAWYTGLAAV